MGYYLGVTVVYGVAWTDAPAEAYPTQGEGDSEEHVEDGEPVYGGRLTWGRHGLTLGDPCRHLEVCEAPSGEDQSLFGIRIPWEEPDASDVLKWDGWIIDYCMSLGMTPEQIPAPGWLALAEWG